MAATTLLKKRKNPRAKILIDLRIAIDDGEKSEMLSKILIVVSSFEKVWLPFPVSIMHAARVEDFQSAGFFSSDELEMRARKYLHSQQFRASSGWPRSGAPHVDVMARFGIQPRPIEARRAAILRDNAPGRHRS
mgnify:CR=1 FL=1